MLEAMSLDATLPQLPLPMTVTLDLCVATLTLLRATVSPPSSAGAIKLRTRERREVLRNAMQLNGTKQWHKEEKIRRIERGVKGKKKRVNIRERKGSLLGAEKPHQFS